MALAETIEELLAVADAEVQPVCVAVVVHVAMLECDASSEYWRAPLNDGVLVAELLTDCVWTLLRTADMDAREVAELHGVEDPEPEAEKQAVSDRVDARERDAVRELEGRDDSVAHTVNADVCDGDALNETLGVADRESLGVALVETVRDAA